MFDKIEQLNIYLFDVSKTDKQTMKIKAKDVFKPVHKTAGRPILEKDLSPEEIDNLTPIGQHIRKLLGNRKQADSFDFMYLVYQVHLKVLDGALPEEIEKDLKKIIECYNLQKSDFRVMGESAKINASSDGLRECLKKPLLIQNFTQVFCDVFSVSGNSSNLKSNETGREDANVIKSLFDIALEQGVPAYSQNETVQESNPQAEEQYKLGAQYQAKLLDQLQRLCDLEERIEPQHFAHRRQSTPLEQLAHRRQSTPLEQLAHRRQPSPLERNSYFKTAQEPAPLERGSSFKKTQQPAPLERSSSFKKTQEPLPPELGTSFKKGVEFSPSLRPSNHPQDPPPLTQGFSIKKSWNAVSTAFSSRKTSSAKETKKNSELLEKLSHMKKCIQDTHVALQLILKSSQAAAPQIMEDRISRCMDEHASVYIELGKQINTAGLEPPITSELITISAENIKDLVLSENVLREEFTIQLVLQKNRFEELEQRLQGSGNRSLEGKIERNPLLEDVTPIKGYVISTLMNLPQITSIDRFVVAFRKNYARFDRWLDTITCEKNRLVVNEMKAIIACLVISTSSEEKESEVHEPVVPSPTTTSTLAF